MAQQPADELGIVSKSIHAESIRSRRCKEKQVEAERKYLEEGKAKNRETARIAVSQSTSRAPVSRSGKRALSRTRLLTPYTPTLPTLSPPVWSASSTTCEPKGRGRLRRKAAFTTLLLPAFLFISK
jgi:hypothetical protein